MKLAPHEIRNKVSVAKGGSGKVAIDERSDESAMVGPNSLKGTVVESPVDPVKDPCPIKYHTVALYPSQHDRLIDAVIIVGWSRLGEIRDGDNDS